MFIGVGAGTGTSVVVLVGGKHCCSMEDDVLMAAYSLSVR